MRVTTSAPTAANGPLPASAAPAGDGFGALLAALLPQTDHRTASSPAGPDQPEVPALTARTTASPSALAEGPAIDGSPAAPAPEVIAGATGTGGETTDGSAVDASDDSAPEEPTVVPTPGDGAVPGWTTSVLVAPPVVLPVPGPPAGSGAALDGPTEDVSAARTGPSAGVAQQPDTAADPTPSAAAPSTAPSTALSTASTSAPGEAGTTEIAIPAPLTSSDRAPRTEDGTMSRTTRTAPGVTSARTSPVVDPAESAPSPGAAASPTQSQPASALPGTDAVPATTTVVTQASGPGPASPSGSPTTASPVAQQVFDQIDRLATSGDGTHRVTVRLDPGTLGEVRVLLTVREGRVQVRLAAGGEARLALTHGAADLQRLLEAHGLGEVRIDVKSLAATTGQPSGPGHQAGQQADQPGQQSGHPHQLPGSHADPEDPGSRTGHHGAAARTRGATTARDGDGNRVESPGSIQPRRSSPPGGVDVRM